jgi:hypothetical protein
MTMGTTCGKLLGLALAGIALVASQGCAASARGSDAMQMSADLYPTAAPGKTAEAVTMPEWVKLYSRSIKGASVVVLRGGIRSVRVHTSTILIYEEIGARKSAWKIVVYDAPTRSLLVSDPGTGSPVIASDRAATNPDGSVDIHFGLNPLRGTESNWIRTSSEIPW